MPNPRVAKTRLRRGSDDASTGVEAKAPSCRGACGSVSKLDSVVSTDALVKALFCRVTRRSVPMLGVEALS